MSNRDDLAATLARAGRRAGFHLLQAVIEGVKAVEAILDEMGKIGDNDGESPKPERITVE
ncbi:MAG: hypothetical protein OEM39_02465 [Acidimicrobiia bacterium]|nr:hypothetical protein [Acidimicrobiia bacterium]